jgi:tRNA (guanosine-2'-O-)-methyltransferase
MTTERRRQRIDHTVAHRQQGVIVLENIESLFNAAAVYRSTEALGFQTVHLIFETVPGFEPKLDGHRAATSAACWLDFVVHESTDDCLTALKAAGYTIVAAMVDDRAESLLQTTIEEPKVALLFGNEETGVSETAAAMADRRIAIPMHGMMQSLNVSVTAALFMHELTRQRIARGFEAYQLPAEQREALTQRFLTQRNVSPTHGARRRRRSRRSTPGRGGHGGNE